MNKIKIVALIGPAGAGKDYLRKRVADLNPQLHNVIGSTTRPPREGELEGVDYYYLTKEQFEEQVGQMQMLAPVPFHEWWYGISKSALDENRINLAVLNPHTLDMLSRYEEIELYPILIKASDKTRTLRQLNRETDVDVEGMIRRFHADKHDFESLEEKYFVVVNEDGSDGVNEITNFINSLS